MPSLNRILIFSKESKGGIGTFLEQISKLNNKDFHYKILLFKKEKLTPRSIKYYLINKNYIENDKPSLTKVYLFFKNLIKTFTILQKEKPNIVVACDLYSNFVLSILKIFCFNKLRLISLINSNYVEIIKNKPNKIYRSFLFFLLKKLFKTVSLFIFVSNGLAKSSCSFFDLPKIKTKVIYNGVDLHKFTKSTIKEKNNLFKIISVGRFNYQKDFETIIRAVKLILKKHQSLKLYLVGEGEEKKSIARLIKSLSLNKNIFIESWVEDINNYYNKADLFIFSSLYEGFGLTIIEAMACGLPIIATDTPFGPSEILEDGKFGFLVPIGNHQKMAEKINMLIENINIRHQYEYLSLKRAKYFDLTKTLRQYRALFINR